MGRQITCRACKRENMPLAADMLCRACYSRWKKNGTFEYKVKGKYQICSVRGCDTRMHAKGLCTKHYTRLQSHGHLEGTRPDSWGAKLKHPLYNAWSNLRRHSVQHRVEQVWLDDFLQFVADVGDKPSPTHKLYRIDDSKPIGPDNFCWQASVTERRPGEAKSAYSARCNRVFRKLDPTRYREYDLKRHYGLSKSKLSQMKAAQDNKCAICKQQETYVIRGIELSLAVDHCHESGKVRELLCGQCNRVLGMANDDPDRLRAAADYLDKHARLK